MTETLNLTTAKPAEIDAVLFPLWADRWFHAEDVFRTKERINASLFPKTVDRFGRTVRDSDSEYYGTSDRFYGSSLAERLAKAADHLAAAEAKLEEVKAAIAPIDAEYHRRGRWTRYVVVKGGHLHKQACHTLRITTASYLLAEASGLTDTEVVDRYDFTACTHCFPDAPVLTTAEKAARSGACTGSGKGSTPINGANAYRPYGKCPDCEHVGALTSRWLVRKHKVVTA